MNAARGFKGFVAAINRSANLQIPMRTKGNPWQVPESIGVRLDRAGQAQGCVSPGSHPGDRDRNPVEEYAAGRGEGSQPSTKPSQSAPPTSRPRTYTQREIRWAA